jgi:hypothetical protein
VDAGHFDNLILIGGNLAETIRSEGEGQPSDDAAGETGHGEVRKMDVHPIRVFPCGLFGAMQSS